MWDGGQIYPVSKATQEVTINTFCQHGYGGFFKCPQGCHSKGPARDYEELDRNIDYFQERVKALSENQSPYFQDKYRTVISVNSRDDRWIIWNWNTCKWDPHTSAERDEIKKAEKLFFS